MTKRQYLPDSSKKLITNSIDGIFERLRYKLLGPYYKPKQGLFTPVVHDKIMSLPGLYASAYTNGPATNQPHFGHIEGLTGVTDAYLQSANEKFKAKAMAEIEHKLSNAAMQPGYDFEQELNDSLVRLFDQAQGHVRTILETETQRAKSVGVADSVISFMESAGEENGNVYALTRMDKSVCKFCSDFYLLSDGVTPRIYKLSELKAGYLDRKNPEPMMTPAHPNCMLGGEARVITQEGFKKLKYVSIGDSVLTHKHRFRKVINTLNWYHTPYTKDFYTVKINRTDLYGVSVTPDHQFLTSKGFMPISKIKDEKMIKCVTPCVMCNKYRNDLYPGYFCTSVCRELFLDNVLENVDKLKNIPKEYVEFTPIIYYEKVTEPCFLYDITVEEDHSFVANGIVSKNCRCLLLYLPKDYRLLPNGKLEYVSQGYDDYEAQKPLKKSIDPAFYDHKCENHE